MTERPPSPSTTPAGAPDGDPTGAADPLQPLQAAPDLVERVRAALMDAITTGALRGGQRLRQEELALQFQVSRQPVLQALRLLKAEGHITDAPGRGLQVAPLDARWIEQVYEVRSALDAMAARLAARAVARRASGAAPTVQAAPAAAVWQPDALISAGRQAARGSSLAALIEADWAFHRALYALADNPLIERSATQHWGPIRRAMGATLQTSSLRASVWDEHEAIAAAVTRGDESAAHRLALGHSESASRHLTERLRQPNAA